MAMISFYKTKQNNKRKQKELLLGEDDPITQNKKLLGVKVSAYQNKYNRIWQQRI